MTNWEVRYNGTESTPVAIMRDGYDVLRLGEDNGPENAGAVCDELNHYSEMLEEDSERSSRAAELVLSLPVRITGEGETKHYEIAPTGPHVDAIAAMQDTLRCARV